MNETYSVIKLIIKFLTMLFHLVNHIYQCFTSLVHQYYPLMPILPTDWKIFKSFQKLYKFPLYNTIHCVTNLRIKGHNSPFWHQIMTKELWKCVFWIWCECLQNVHFKDFFGGGHHKLRDIPNHLTVINYPSSNLPKWLSGKESTCQCRRHKDVGSIPGSWRSSYIGNGNLLQHSCLKTSMDRERSLEGQSMGVTRVRHDSDCAHIHTFPGELWVTSDMQMTLPLWQKAKKNYRASWLKWNRRVKKLA